MMNENDSVITQHKHKHTHAHTHTHTHTILHIPHVASGRRDIGQADTTIGDEIVTIRNAVRFVKLILTKLGGKKNKKEHVNKNSRRSLDFGIDYIAPSLFEDHFILTSGIRKLETGEMKAHTNKPTNQQTNVHSHDTLCSF